MVKLLRVIAYVAVSLLLSTQVALAVTSLYFRHHELQLMVLTGESMSPTYHIGDAVVLDTKPGQIDVGDIITFRDTTGRVTTHRVIAARHVKGDLHFQTQGDANSTPDPNLASAKAVIGVPVHHFPGAGATVQYLNSRDGRLLTYGPALGLILIVELLNLARAAREEEDLQDDDQQNT